MAVKGKKALGMGFSELIGGFEYSRGIREFIDSDFDRRDLPITKLVAGAFQPRRIFEETKLNELAESIRQNGILQPILVRKISEDDDIYEIIAGERRFRAASIAGLERVPVVIRNLSDQSCLEISIIENVQRSDLTPIEEANAYKRLIDDFSYTHEKLGSIVGKSRSHITNTLRLLNLPDNLQSMVNENLLSASHARTIISSDDPSSIAEKVVSENLSVKETERIVKSGNNERKFENRSEIVEMEEYLSEVLGMKVLVKFFGNKKKLIIEFDELSQITDIIKSLVLKD